MVAAATDNSLWVGRFGKPLQQRAPLGGKSVRKLRVRSDGTLVVLLADEPGADRDGDVLYVLPSRGKVLIRSRYQDTDLDRRGDWMRGDVATGVEGGIVGPGPTRTIEQERAK